MSSSAPPDQSTVLYLYSLSHRLSLGPLAKQYSNHFAHFANLSGVNLPDAIDDKFCDGCGIINIPGITSSTRIKYPTKRRTKQHKKTLLKHNAPDAPPQRILQTQCLECKHTKSQHHAPLVTHSAKSRLATPSATSSPSPHPASQQSAPASSQDTQTLSSSLSKKSRKRKQQNDLSNLLAAKKKQDQQNKKSSLNLMEFMQ